MQRTGLAWNCSLLESNGMRERPSIPAKHLVQALRAPAESSGTSLAMLAEDFSDGVTDPGLLGELH